MRIATASTFRARNPRYSLPSAVSILLGMLFACAPLTATPPAGYSLVWSDEFDGAEVDGRSWNILTGPYNDGNRTANAITVGGGHLTITTYTQNGVHYTGFLSTRDKYQPLYGYIEARIESLVTSGVNHAFWLQSPWNGAMIGDPWNAGIEIDIVEHRAYRLLSNPLYIGDSGTSSLHWDGYTSTNHKTRGSTRWGSGLASGFHVYAVEWTPDYAAFYLDGVQVWLITNSNNPAEIDLTKGPIPRRSEYIYLTAAVDHGDFSGPIPAPGYAAREASATQMKVDYVRVYQRNPGAPPRPEGLVAGSGNAQAMLRWVLPANAVTHTIKRATTPGGPYATVASEVGGTGFTDIGLVNGVTYYYVVSAVSSSGESAHSVEASATPAANFETVIVDNSDAAHVTLTGTWTTSTGAAGFYGSNFLHDGNTGATGGKSVLFSGSLPATTDYEVYLNWTSSSNRAIRVPVDVIHAGGTTTVMVDQTADGGTWYLLGTFPFHAGTAGGVRVRNDLMGASGFVVADAVGFVRLPLPPPTGVRASAASSSQIDLAWTGARGAGSYDVKRSPTSGGPYTLVASGVIAESYMDTGLSHNTTYYYVVSATNSTGVSADSAEASARTPPPVPTVAIANVANGAVTIDWNTPPGASVVQLPFAPPTGVTANTVSSTQVDLSWAATTPASSYNIKRSTASGGPYVTVAIGVVGARYTDAPLSAATTYYYVLSSATPGGEGPPSVETSATTSPASPSSLAASAGNAQIALSWASTPGALSYRIKRSTSSGGPYAVITETAQPVFTDTGLVNGSTYYYVVSAVNAGGESEHSGEVSATPLASVTIIKDNADATGVVITGAWTTATSTTGFYGNNYLQDGNTGNVGGKKVTFTPTLPFAGDYEVYARWTAFSNRATNVPIDVSHANGTSTVTVNQRTNNGTWVLLGTYSFAAGTAGNITVRNDGADGYVVADAVRLISK